ncbi:type II toxin-antitoxin system RelE/ParE family toxin [Streptomyces sp. NPDC053726]|uniref:type II toxin-antitoxin system RelE/ParE family toxin n=1 Tax=Streptomyces sp. NPDC053726 TaxID=3365713 RepID=UPI0037D67FD8
MSEQPPYEIRFSPQAAKTLWALPGHAAEIVDDLLDTASVGPRGFARWDPTDPEGGDVRIASVGQLSIVFFINEPLRHLYVLDIVWLG